MAGPLAVLATAGAVTLGVLTAGPAATDPAASLSARVTAADLTAMTTDLGDAGADVRRLVSRSASRSDAKAGKHGKDSKLEKVLSKKATRKAVKHAEDKRWTTAPLNLWTEPGEKGKRDGEIAASRKVLVTGRSLYGRVEIVLDHDVTRWVTHGYLAEDKPDPDPLNATCSNGTTADSGVSPNIVKVHQAVCAAYPDISVYGYFRGGETDHATGHAVDIMVAGSEGQAVADFVRANAAELGVSYVIFAQHIWSVQRSAEGWRMMPNRGSTTANHYDHVHVSVY